MHISAGQESVYGSGAIVVSTASICVIDDVYVCIYVGKFSGLLIRRCDHVSGTGKLCFDDRHARRKPKYLPNALLTNIKHLKTPLMRFQTTQIRHTNQMM